MSDKKETGKAKNSKEGLTRFPDGMPHSDRLNEILEKAKKKKALTSAEMMRWIWITSSLICFMILWPILASIC